MKQLFAIAMILPLAGCAMDTSMQKAEAEAEATRAGCLCAGARCGILISGSGQAAAGAEVAGALRSLTLEGKERPQERPQPR